MPPTTRSRPWTEPLVLKLLARHPGGSAEQIIERHADKLRREAEQHEMPIDVELVASVQGVKHRRAGHDFAGRIYADLDGQLVMDLNDQDGAERQRFTCAHELIHLAFPNFKKETRYRLDAKIPGRTAAMPRRSISATSARPSCSCRENSSLAATASARVSTTWSD